MQIEKNADNFEDPTLAHPDAYVLQARQGAHLGPSTP